jgi:membrane-bound serine protease (ClpP class)
VQIGPEALVGAIGVAQQALAPRGQILVHGELWVAVADAPVAAGDNVRVRAIDGLKLLVEPVPSPHGSPNLRESVSV